jgi:uncharacterized RDD family membrane protein YckC
MTGALKEGVYYALDDYAGVGRRLVILTIDGIITLALLAVTLASFLYLTPNSRRGFQLHMLVFVCVAFLYLAVLARSTWGTLGYKLMGVRIVSLTGQVPKLGSMAYRTLFAVLGPMNGLLDIAWLAGDANRQSVRDKLAGTYIVKQSAVPAGRGRLRRATLSVFGYTIMVQEVGQDVT